MADQRKTHSTPNDENKKQRPRGKTGRDDTFRDPNARDRPRTAARSGTSAATTAASAGKPARKAPRAADAAA